jgi:single-stranded DNA-binding protein
MARLFAFKDNESNGAWSRTLIYLEGDATMKTYEDGEGRKQTQLNLVQTKVEVLKRPNPVAGEAAPQAA